MSTNSTINIKHKDGSIDSIYCHNDGYIEHHGPILTKYYTTPEAVKELITLGSLSVLEKSLKPSTPNHSFDHPENDVCIAYHRDRNEEYEKPIHFKSVNNFAYDFIYNYMFDETDEKWYATIDNDKVWHSLDELAKKIKTVKGVSQSWQTIT